MASFLRLLFRYRWSSAVALCNPVNTYINRLAAVGTMAKTDKIRAVVPTAAKHIRKKRPNL